MMAGPGNLTAVRRDARRLTAAVDDVLTPGERLASTAIGWAAQLRPRVPLVFLGRRQYWFVLTDRRLLVFGRRRGGPTADDLVLGKRYTFFTLERVHRLRPLFQLRIQGANDSRLVLEFRPRQRSVAAELAARLTRSPSTGVPVSGPFEPAPATATAMLPAKQTRTQKRAARKQEKQRQATAAAESASAPAPDSPDPDRDNAAAFWGEH